jgi:hypothetical protein
MPRTHYATGGTLGVDLENVTSSADVATYGNKHRLGAIVKGNNASEWMYVYASAAITQYFTVGVEASGTASPLSVTNARLANAIGIAQVAFAAGDYGWVALEGQSLRVATTAAVAVGKTLFTAASTPGRVDDAAASTQAQIAGLRLIATASGTSASSAACIARNLVVVDAEFIVDE